MIDRTTEERMNKLAQLLAGKKRKTAEEKTMLEDLIEDLAFLDSTRSDEASRKTSRERTAEVDELIEGKVDDIIIKKLDE